MTKTKTTTPIRWCTVARTTSL